MSLASALGVRLRCWLASRLLDLSWLAWFFMAKDTAATLCRGARAIVPETSSGLSLRDTQRCSAGASASAGALPLFRNPPTGSQV